MKLCRIETDKGIVPAAVDGNGALRDLSAHISDIDAAQISPEGLAKLATIALEDQPEITGTFLPFLSDVRRVFCIGLNYYDHAEEMKMAIPAYPILFMKACDVTGPTDPIVVPKGALKTDWEVELGVVIGSRALHVDEADALDHVAGYFVANDVSERHFQMELGGQWVKGKSADSFAPIGPYLVTKDEIADPQNLAMSLDVSGQRMQTGTTATMIFSVTQIVSHLSQYLTLRPGDLILTGTPPGVGGGQKPPRFLRPGDVVTAEIAGLGTMRQEVVAFES
ncbi:MAG: fumarylacetoacetate hydrolase family protein [Yoonia sp.]|uniref:fumarylacetoacetate hydrolase family protein n=1 Tax=Yoonia sp. TaxID=2212373 RepID=UPI00273F08D2|nr:fumarylacetoacetate hydrolase family protein [Yoonia sp.]MDP5085725.1 fumarylacetoacetate hydrolase family protein [Yoonia sp.]